MKKNNSKQPNANQFNTPEFASETDVQEVREQNRQSSIGQSQNQSNASEFASETDIQHVKEQNRQAESKKQQATAQKSSSSFNQTK
jgi:small acid-soluble spore protein E (minor gamma-type SASP)